MKNMLETLRSYAEAGKYKRVPVSRELYADAFTPVEVMRWKVRRTNSAGEDILSSDMRLQWRSLVRMVM